MRFKAVQRPDQADDGLAFDVLPDQKIDWRKGIAMVLTMYISQANFLSDPARIVR